MHIAQLRASTPPSSLRLRYGTAFLAVAALFATAATNAAGPVSRPGDYAARPSESTTAAQLADYFLQIEEILFTRNIGTGASTREEIELTRNRYHAQYIAALRLKVPVEARAAHRRLVESLRTQAEGARRSAQLTPASLPKTDDNVTAYEHSVPDVGYGRNDQAEAACDLKRLADALDKTLNVLGFCAQADAARPAGKTLGSPTAPVNDIYMLQDVAYDPASGQPRPNVDGFQYSTIYAKAGKPIRIRFDNRNPRPFVFNIAIYDNPATAERVSEPQLVAKSAAYSGLRVHTVTTTLRPGVYAYVDDVHPQAMRGRLIVVP